MRRNWDYPFDFDTIYSWEELDKRAKSVNRKVQKETWNITDCEYFVEYDNWTFCFIHSDGGWKLEVVVG